MPADILRDLAVNPPTATAPEPVPLESSLERERERAVAGREEAYAGARQALERRSEAVRGPAEAARAATEAPLASPPESPVLPSPPSLRPRAFLEGPGDEPPIQTLQRFLAGMGTIASSFGSLVMGDAATANAALTGALRGWKKGDVERMNLEMTRWKNATDLALNKADLARKNYRDILENQKLSLDQKMKAMEITAAMHGDQILLHELDAKRWDNAIKELDHRQDVLTKFRMQVANLEMRYMMARSTEEQRKIANELARARLEQTKLRREERMREPLSGSWIDTKTGEVGMVPTRGDFDEDPKRYVRTSPTDIQTHELLSTAMPMLDRLKVLIPKLLTKYPGANLVNLIKQQARSRAGIDPDITEFKNLNLEVVLEAARGVSGGRMLVTIVDAMMNNVVPNLGLTREAAEREVETTRRSIENRMRSIERKPPLGYGPGQADPLGIR